MEMYTSYYGNKEIPKNAFRVQISTSRPKDYQVDMVWESVFPDFSTMVQPIKAGDISEKEYIRRYLASLRKDEVMSGLDILVRLANGRPIILLCYCGKADDNLFGYRIFCHRHILASYIMQHRPDINIEEL